MAITKNRQSEDTISGMAKRAFPDKQIAEIKELTPKEDEELSENNAKKVFNIDKNH